MTPYARDIHGAHIITRQPLRFRSSVRQRPAAASRPVGWANVGNLTLKCQLLQITNAPGSQLTRLIAVTEVNSLFLWRCGLICLRSGKVGLVEDVTSRDGIIASMQDVSLKQYLFLRNLAEPLIERLGIDEALAILDRAFAHYGQWRGETIRMSQASLVTGHDAIAFLYNWDSCDFVLAKLDSEVTAAGTPEKASLRVP